ncbi:MAG: hypothetical protein J7K71_03040, partial [Candidatus Omnitrophica bacterium]|nr:hypothetical protein [Candidatus Omnitrophota bacterium]
QLPSSLTSSGNFKIAIEEDSTNILKEGGNVNIANYPSWLTSSTKTTDDLYNKLGSIGGTVSVSNMPADYVKSSQLPSSLTSNGNLKVAIEEDVVGLATESTLSKFTNALASVGSDKFIVSVSGTVSTVQSASAMTTSLSNQTVNASSSLTLLNVSGKGMVHEVTVISEASTFKLTVSVDGSTMWDVDFNTASQYTDDIVFVSAFENEDGKYVYHLSDIPFTSSVTIMLTNTDSSNSITVDYAFVKYVSG